MLLKCLELKGKEFSSFSSGSEQDTDFMWEIVQVMDSSIEKDESLTKKNRLSKQGLTAFMKHCCTSHHYKKSVDLNLVLCADQSDFQNKFSTSLLARSSAWRRWSL